MYFCQTCEGQHLRRFFCLILTLFCVKNPDFSFPSPNSRFSRREALSRLLVAGASTLIGCSSSGKQQAKVTESAPTEQFKLVIKNGTVFSDGILQKLNVGITTEGTLRLHEVDLQGEKVIDASGKIVSPGFVDILADDSYSPEQSYKTFEKYKLTDGLTTVLQLHGGAENPSAYHQFFDKKQHWTNYGVGIFVMRIRAMIPDEAARLKHVEKMLDEGALAVCHSLEYQPTPYPEVLKYAKLARKYNRPMFLHLRYSSREKELEGIKEAIRLAQEAGIRLHINHLHSTGGTFNMPEALRLIKKARNAGSEITCCIYPYTYWATYLYSKRFDPGWKEMYGLDYKDLRLVGTPMHLNARTFELYRRKPGHLVAVPEGTMPFKTTIDLALQEDFCLIGSDGGIVNEKAANSHPRGAGCFATAIRHAIDINLPLEKLLPKITSLPANLVRPALTNRGELKNGYIADITIFDPKTIRGKASVENPNQFSTGIDAVILGGNIVFQNSTCVEESGHPIRLSSHL